MKLLRLPRCRLSALQKAYVFTLLLVAVGLVLLYKPQHSTAEEAGKEWKIANIEHSIRSPLNQRACQVPNLPIDNPEIMKFYEQAPPIDCHTGDAVDWVVCEQSQCFIKPSHASTAKCTYNDIIRKTDYRARYGPTVRSAAPYVLRESDFVRVACVDSESGARWSSLLAGIRENATRARQTPATTNAGPYYNVLMFGLDSLSRNAFMRKLPKTYELLTQQLGAIVLEGYNIVGDGTPQALVPLLTGYTELELPETRKRMYKSMPVDVYPFIWQDFQRIGYVTSFNEDLPNVGTFTYRMNGFEQQPVHHYMRTLYVEAANTMSNSAEHCIGATPDHKIMLKYTHQFVQKYSDVPYFIFSFHGGLSHDSINLVGVADEDLYSYLSNWQRSKLLRNTILILMADHGNRFADVRKTLQGKQEERLPFFSFVFPESFKQHHPQEYANFVDARKRLTTPFDIHATFKHLISLQTGQTAESKPESLSELAQRRAVSLFEPLPKNRSCADAYIEPHWCACLQWQPIELNDTRYASIVWRAAQAIVSTINAATEPKRALCERIQLQHINYALRLIPHKDLLTFKTNLDLDGFVADMTGETEISEEAYQLQITTLPGNALFEATVTYYINEFRASTKLTDISRINEYGRQAFCIYERDPELRKFCYCRGQV